MTPQPKIAARRKALFRPIVFTGVAVTLLIVLLLVSGVFIRSFVARAFKSAAAIDATRTLASDVLQDQVDEETGVRGYAATHDPQFLQPYGAARAAMPQHFHRLLVALGEASLDDAARAAAAAVVLNAQWNSVVAIPLLHPERSQPRARLLQVRGKQLVDRFRDRVQFVDEKLVEREGQLDEHATSAIDRIGLFIAASVLLVALVAVALIRQQRDAAVRLERERARRENERRRTAELQSALAAEKRIADILQDAIAQRPLPLHPSMRFSATYVPATEETKVGGDWYDAFELPGGSVLFTIGDVAGHGIDAAVAMSRSRQALIISALRDSDPASVLARANAELVRENAPMVTAVAGFADARTFEFVYATAGHPPPVLVEPNRPPRMLDFGGVPLGVVPGATYRTHRIQSVPGAMLVLYTDGAVEHSRDVLQGEAILLDAVTQAAQRPDVDSATIIHNGIFDGRSVGDDVAILTVGFGTGSAATLKISADNAQNAFAGRIARPAGVSETSLIEEVLQRPASSRWLERRAS